MNSCAHPVLLTIAVLSLIAAMYAPASASAGTRRSNPGLAQTISFQWRPVLAYADPAPAASDQWWTARTAGYFGGIGGSALGVLGAMIGVLGGALRMWGFARYALNAMIIIGAVCTVVGLYAVFADQPYHVFYPLLLTGVLCLVLGIVLRFTLAVVRRQHELHRMHAMDAS